MICPPCLFFTVHNFGNKKTVITGLYQSAISYGFFNFRVKILHTDLNPQFFSNDLFLVPPFVIFLAGVLPKNPARWFMQTSGFKQSWKNDDMIVTCHSIVWIYTRRFNVYHPQCHRNQRSPWPRPQHRLRHPGASFGDLMPD
jgi:hypothetical protein